MSELSDAEVEACVICNRQDCSGEHELVDSSVVDVAHAEAAVAIARAEKRRAAMAPIVAIVADWRTRFPVDGYGADGIVQITLTWAQLRAIEEAARDDL